MKSSTLLLSAFVAVLVIAGHSAAEDDLRQRASWTPPTAEAVKAELESWLGTFELDEATRLKVDALWADPVSSDQLLDRVAATLAAASPPVRELVNYCLEPRREPVLPEFEVFQQETTPAVVRNNLSLYLGRWLAQHQMYDEALTQLKELKPEDVVDPAALFFYRSVAHHHLLEKQACLAQVAKLMENEALLPRRYRTVAQLMDADLRPLKTDSLDEVSRLMSDIRRRLGLGRAGKRVRKEEDDVIAKLDKMIEEMEKQQQQQSGGSGGNLAPSSPMQDSNPGGGRGPGNVDQKNIGRESGWGNLPPRERQEALQEITKDLPAHYRQVIEEYFRKLAREGS